VRPIWNGFVELLPCLGDILAMTNRNVVDIRSATAIDADGISRTVIRALRETNARDYAPHIIDAVVANFSPEHVASFLASREAYVATADGMIVGTASLSGEVVRTVFVDPDHQGEGIGTKLMDFVDNAARAQSIAALTVPSSITAQALKVKLRFVPIREELYGDERTIIMTKTLASHHQGE
jgi:GNAT superfamily N-acetyltransferase